MKELDCIEELEVPILFNRITKNFNKKLGDFLMPYGLSKLHSFYMMCLFMNKRGLTLNQLNFLTACDKANTSRAIADLEEKGVVARTNNENEKKYKVMLTEKGLEIGQEFVKAIKENIKNTFKVLTDNELMTFRNIISKLIIGESDDSNKEYC